MAPSLSLTTILVLFSVLLSSTLPLHASAHSRGGFSVELIHRDSPKSPYYNPSSTHYDRIISASHRSISRADYLLRSSSKSGPGFQSKVIPSGSEYLMTLTIGTPGVKQLFLADTGSDTIWTQCKPCKSCIKQQAHLFDPSKSSTYKKVGCHSPVCKDSDRETTCSRSDNSCHFSMMYGGGAQTSGVISSDTIGFDSTAGRGDVSIPKLAFGCSNHISGWFPANSSGVVGLSGGPSSLITQLSSRIAGKFAYCLVPYENTSTSSVLSFGDKAVVGGKGAVTTPLVKGDNYSSYFITLEYITVSGSHGGGKIAVNRAGSSAGPVNVLVDSGTTMTLLYRDVVLSVEKQVSAVVKLPPAKPKGLFRLCFNATKQEFETDLPDITFKYTGGAVKLSPMNTFTLLDEGIACLMMLPNWLPIIGNFAQQNFHVGYDLQARTVTFAPADCANL